MAASWDLLYSRTVPLPARASWLPPALLVACGPSSASTEAHPAGGTSTGATGETTTGVGASTGDDGVTRLLGQYHPDEVAPGVSEWPNELPPLFFGYRGLEIRADGTLIEWEHDCYTGDQPIPHVQAWEPLGDEIRVRAPDGGPPLWYGEAFDDITIRAGEGEGVIMTRTVAEETTTASFSPRLVCVYGTCCDHYAYCDEVPQPEDPHCPPDDPPDLEFELSTAPNPSQTWPVQLECTIAAAGMDQLGETRTFDCLEDGAPVEVAPVLSFAGDPAPDLSALAIGEAVTLVYERAGWLEYQLQLAVRQGDALLLGAVRGGGEFVGPRPFAFTTGSHVCAPECDSCSKVQHRGVALTLDGVAADLPGRSFAEVGDFDVWIDDYFTPVSPVQCSDTSGGATHLAAVRRAP